MTDENLNRATGDAEITKAREVVSRSDFMEDMKLQRLLPGLVTAWRTIANESEAKLHDETGLGRSLRAVQMATFRQCADGLERTLSLRWDGDSEIRGE
jgi:hypothetical protein